MVDLSKLKVGDTVKFRNGSTSLVNGFSIDNNSVFPCAITFADGGKVTCTINGFYLYDKFSDSDIVEIISKTQEPDKPKVDLSKLKVGDTVKFRNGLSSEVKDIFIKNKYCSFPYSIRCEDRRRMTYTREGFFYSDRCVNGNDIIEIIPQEKEQEVIRNHVDLHNIAEGDVVYFEDGSEAVVDDVIFNEHFVDLDFYDFGTFQFNYDGSKFLADAEVGNIKHVLHGAPESVEHPSHYTFGGIECIDAIKASMTTEAYKGFLKGNVLKYLWRYESKGKPVEDLKKAKTYLEWLIKEAEK